MSCTWQQIQREHEFSDKADGFWTDLKECTELFDKFVDINSFDDIQQLSYGELRDEVAKEVFVGDRAKFLPSFQFFLRVNKELSDAAGHSLYGDPSPKKKARAGER